MGSSNFSTVCAGGVREIGEANFGPTPPSPMALPDQGPARADASKQTTNKQARRCAIC